MKVVLIGVGQAGGKVTQSLAEFDYEMGFNAVRGALAVNTARPDLQNLDIDTALIGQDRVKGHGVGGDNELGAQIMQENATEVLENLDGRITTEAEAVVIVAGLGGGTGSGGAPMLARELKRIYEMPVYVLGILPGKDEGGLYQANAGRSLKTAARESDSLLLVDNDAWRGSGDSVADGYKRINDAISQRVGLLLASGEAVEGVGESVVDSSEIINTLRGGGISSIGYASAQASEDPSENVNTITSVTRNALLTSMSLPNAVEAESALLVVAGDPERLSRKGVERARRWVEDETGSMEVRGGDFPLGSDKIAALVVLSGVERSGRVDDFMRKANEAAKSQGGTVDPNEFDNENLDSLL
ncbi:MULTISPECIES: tubulin/FtsZ family protein [Haloarcula]|uniref:Tubulin-like protein CetZ n=1 Tax=Haloarcula pellucida TaxID=1427151 RepID=A0A830GGF7_9EURY|nr:MULTISPECIES: tubulin/FtsZ family protein [Halomicroarcula]MBX0346861.1 tubulin/FtsZ family protein [Halomicroarcula pellucida]MDS0277265.1 tubulin/FtsZ family protein [Halomicroarcula sp. S1AR25-4]GGN85827.1 cell division protein [Halomicroarcula pellucida]